MVYINFYDIYSSSLSSNWFTKFNVTNLSLLIWQIFWLINNAATRHHWIIDAQHLLRYSTSTTFIDARHLKKFSRHPLSFSDARHLKHFLSYSALEDFSRHSNDFSAHTEVELSWLLMLGSHKLTQLGFTNDLVKPCILNVSKCVHSLCLRVCHQYIISSLS